MKRYSAKRTRRIASSAAAAAALIWGGAPSQTLAKNWADGTALWNVNSNWNPAAVPTLNEAVNIVFTDGTPRTVFYNVNAPSLGLFCVDLIGPGTGASAFSMSTANTISANGILIGGYNGTTATPGRGAVTQSAGSMTINSGLDFVLGHGVGSTGTFALSGTGLLTANQSEYIGLSGTGSFTQSGGINNIATPSGFFNIGSASGSKGTYNLSGGTLTVNTNEAVGYDGTGSFSQSGGSHSASMLYLAKNSAGAIGNYTLTAGTLSTSGGVQIGVNGIGTFTQQGGTHTIGTAGMYFGYNPSAIGSYALSGNALLTSAGDEYIGFDGSGSFTQTGGTHTVGTTLTTHSLNFACDTGYSTATYNLSGASSVLTVNGTENMGIIGTATFTQTGGTHTIAAGGNLRMGTSLTGGATYSLQGGTLACGSAEYIGDLGQATFAQSGGSHTVAADLTLGFVTNARGMYTLSGGSLNTLLATYVGFNSGTTATFAQTGGTHTIGDASHTSALTVGVFFGATGTYSLSGGTLIANGASQIGGSGNGAFIQTGGTHTINSGAYPFVGLYMASIEDAVGTYSLSGTGVLNVNGDAYVGGQVIMSGGQGVMNLNGGIANITGLMKVWNTTGTAINLNGGRLNVGSIDTDGNPAHFNWSAGALNITTTGLTVGSGGPLGGSLVIDINKSLTTAGPVVIDPFAALTLDGGTITTPDLVRNGTFNFLRGTLAITGAGGTTIGSSGALGATVTLGANQQLNVTNLTTVSGNGLLVLQNGTLGAIGGVFNNGEVQLDGATSQITGGTFTNNKLLLGNGRLVSNLTNTAAGEVRVSNTDRIIFNGGTNTSSGKINLINGGTIEFPSGLSNGGQVQVTGGSGDFFGNLTNTTGGKTIVTGNSTLSLFNNVTNNAGSEFRVSTGSTAIFFGAVSGAGAFTGGGMKVFEGGAPSSLTAINSITGDTLVDASVSVSAGVVREDDLAVYGRLSVLPDGTSAATSRVNTLLVAPGGQMDLSNNKLIVASSTAGAWTGSAYTGVSGLVQSGRNGAAWNGSGLITTQAAANASNYTTLAVARASDVRPATATTTALWGGQVITGTDVLVMYTYGGDANLDGKINVDDYIKIDSGIAAGLTGWSNGDFNYDGKVNIDDYTTVIDANIGNQTGVFPTAIGSESIGGVTAIPEPAALSLLLALGLPLRGRRRRHG